MNLPKHSLANFVSNQNMDNNQLTTHTLQTWGAPGIGAWSDVVFCPGKKYIFKMERFPRTDPLRDFTTASITESS